MKFVAGVCAVSQVFYDNNGLDISPFFAAFFFCQILGILGIVG